MQLSQLLSQDGISFAREYGNAPGEYPGCLEWHVVLRWSTLYINRANVLFWVFESPRITVANPLQPCRQSYHVASIIGWSMNIGRTQCLLYLIHEISSPAQTLGPCVWIPLEAWISVRIYSVFVLSYVGSGLTTGWSPVQGVLSTVL
jgi:hypothetical protein